MSRAPAAPGAAKGGRIGKVLRDAGPEILVNAVLPALVYSVMRDRFGEVPALMASAVPPLVWVGAELAFRRRLDAMSGLVLCGIGLSLLALAGGGGARILQLRESLVLGVIGLAFLVSTMLRRPLMFYLARAATRRGSADAGASFDGMQESARFRRVMTVMSLVWGFGLIARTAAAVVLVFTLSIPTYLVVNPIVGYGAFGALGLWTSWYAAAQRRRGAAERALREAAGDVSASDPRVAGS